MTESTHSVRGSNGQIPSPWCPIRRGVQQRWQSPAPLRPNRFASCPTSQVHRLTLEIAHPWHPHASDFGSRRSRRALAHPLACAALATKAFLQLNLVGLDVSIAYWRLPLNLLMHSQVDFMVFRFTDHLRSAFQEELIFLLGHLFLPLINGLENEGFQRGNAEALGQFGHPLLLNTLEQTGGSRLKDCGGSDELLPIQHIILDGTGRASLQADFQLSPDALAGEDRIIREGRPFLLRRDLPNDVSDVEAVCILPHETSLVAGEALGKPFQTIHPEARLEIRVALGNLSHSGSLNLPCTSQVSQDELEAGIPIKVGVDGLLSLEDGLRNGHGLGDLDSLDIRDRDNFQHASGSGIVAELILGGGTLLDKDRQAGPPAMLDHLGANLGLLQNLTKDDIHIAEWVEVGLGATIGDDIESERMDREAFCIVGPLDRLDMGVLGQLRKGEHLLAATIPWGIEVNDLGVSGLTVRATEGILRASHGLTLGTRHRSAMADLVFGLVAGIGEEVFQEQAFLENDVGELPIVGEASGD